jgi:hypothetical protein
VAKGLLAAASEHPKEYRGFTITFSTGSIRGISPAFAPDEFRVEWNQEEEVLYTRNTTKGLNDDLKHKVQNFEFKMRAWELIYTTGGEKALDELEGKLFEDLDGSYLEAALAERRLQELEAKKTIEGLRRYNRI